ncbi:hypothetical protein SLEP1_g57691 [Rubroshorea leprosula]|uniref:HMA domain-containing protein n=1 Tax=Rubroshorea leprosula TaxID=152421 RepID=A0AAV5MPF0_9ROSI|nr:hypothetical protein SLEP1_g57691 [Rubroshorea leprosula]
MAEKVTTMLLNVVDLQCSKCYKKIKKLLCNFPEIRDQEYDEKANKVTIKVVSCWPEKIRDKLRCKGCGCIKSIEIVKPKPPEKPKPPPSPPKLHVDLQLWGFCCFKCYSGRLWGPCSCGGRVPNDPCYGRPIYDRWCGYGSGCGETQPGCSIM